MAIALTASCDAVERTLFTPKIKVACQILQKTCRFTNYGDPGEACVEVKVFHYETGLVHTSAPTCSGRLERDEPRVVEIHFPGGDPVKLCMGDDLKQDFKTNCEVEIREFEPKMPDQ